MKKKREEIERGSMRDQKHLPHSLLIIFDDSQYISKIIAIGHIHL